jgi:para-aminobenzoate synthetase
VSGSSPPSFVNDSDEIPRWQVRDATAEDRQEVARALGELLGELGGAVPARSELESATVDLLASPEHGCLLLAETADGALIGVLAASFQHAIHVPGRYCILQDLWSNPSWRSRRVGAQLLTELIDRLRVAGIGRLEVGLPSARFNALASTEAFYIENGFAPLGPRMRLVIA